MNKSPLAGKTVKIKKEANSIGGETLRVEDYWINVSGKSWMECNGYPAAMSYGMRTGLSDMPIPTDDKVLYGKIGSSGYLVHESEIETDETKG